MKINYLIFLFLVFVANVHASDDNNKTLSARVFHNLLFDKKLATAISSLNKVIGEIKDKHIKHLYSNVVEDYWRGNTHYTTTNHYYDGDGFFIIEVVNRYKKALENLDTSNALLAAGDGAILGLLVATIGKIFKWSNKSIGTSLILSAALLTLAKNKQVGKVPYLTFPTLTPKDNYFGAITNVVTFLCIVGVGAASYFGSNFVMDAISDKISAIKMANSSECN